MILIVNSMIDITLAESFNTALSRIIAPMGRPLEFLNIQSATCWPDPSDYSHIILSGSEASALDDNFWNGKLTDLIRDVVLREKPLLGICYGHQFLMRALAGVDKVRKSKTPEFGFIRIHLTDNPLFAGLSSPSMQMVSHYDEVTDLPGDFTIIASSPRCAVHAVQYKSLPVWSVQFHPEYNRSDADEIFLRVKAQDPEFPHHYFNELEDDNPETVNPLEQNRLIFQNFLKC